MDQPQQGLPSFALPSLSNSNLNAMQSASYGHDVDEELIPTAIVIKNIPFAVKKEQLVQLMTDLRLPLPYAFNYHFDNGVFRGLAFANFTTADETAAVIESMNHFELNGRKLRVEYKKMLPLAERERIEREKRERRGQLEEQHRPLGGGLQSQPSFGSLASHIPATSPSPVSAMRGGIKSVGTFCAEKKNLISSQSLTPIQTSTSMTHKSCNSIPSSCSSRRPLSVIA